MDIVGLDDDPHRLNATIHWWQISKAAIATFAAKEEVTLALCIISSLPRMRAAAVNLVPNFFLLYYRHKHLRHQPRPLRHQFSPSNASCSQARRRSTTRLCLSLYARSAHATIRYILTYAGVVGCQQPTHVSIRQHTSAYVRIRQHTSVYSDVCWHCWMKRDPRHTHAHAHIYHIYSSTESR
jgi:hypothetical protein